LNATDPLQQIYQPILLSTSIHKVHSLHFYIILILKAKYFYINKVFYNKNIFVMCKCYLHVDVTLTLSTRQHRHKLHRLSSRIVCLSTTNKMLNTLVGYIFKCCQQFLSGGPFCKGLGYSVLLNCTKVNIWGVLWHSLDL